jgi:SAM-dependent methyltransferase
MTLLQPESAPPGPIDAAEAGAFGRLRAWWNGDKPAVRTAAPQSPPAVPVAEPAADGWDAARIAAAQLLFGQYEARPALAPHVEALVALNLNAANKVAVVGAGLGGVVRHLAATGPSVAGIDFSPALAQASEGLVRHGADFRLRLQPQSVDVVVALEAIHPAPRKSPVLLEIRRALNPGGRFLFSDYVRVCEPDNPGYMIWHLHERGHPHLMSVQDVDREFADLGFIVERQEDVTAAYRATIMAAFARMANPAVLGGASPDVQAAMVTEARLWTQRLALLQGGDAIVRRILARAL